MFGDNQTKKLLCAWHVDRAWRQGLREHVQTKSDQVEIYHYFLQNVEQSKFRPLLPQFLTFISSKEHRCIIYFKNHYCSRVELSNGHLKSNCKYKYVSRSFQRTLKVKYLHHKHNRRVDYILTTLLKVARDKAFERFRKLEKGKRTHRIFEINKRHKAAEKMAIIFTNTSTTAVSETEWEVPSQWFSNIQYTVKKVLKTCECQLLCSTSNICIHLYYCSCLDATIDSTVCKHVHLLHIVEDGNHSKSTTVSNTTPEGLDYTYFSSIVLSSTTDSIKAKQQLQHKIQELHWAVEQCSQLDAFTTAYKRASCCNNDKRY